MFSVLLILALSAAFEDTLADIISWVVFIIVPVLFISVFWLVHILPEKYAHKRHHPQADAIHAMCLLSLVFGGLLWPLAMIWAFMKTPKFQVEQVPRTTGGGHSDQVVHPAPAGDPVP